MRASSLQSFNNGSIARFYSTGVKSDMLFSMLSLKIGWASQVQDHPDSEKMYVSKIQVSADAGENGTESVSKQVCSGLRNYVAANELQGQLLVIVDNMKKCKLRGQVSEAMVLCGDDSTRDVVKPCMPAVFDRRLIGKQVFLKGCDEQIEAPTRKIKTGEWQELSKRLIVNGSGEVVYHDPTTQTTTPLCVHNGQQTVSIVVDAVATGTPVR
ncbi:LAME_0H03004g1_1 [Lachancea meyersii CBS 8951]|uniref:LAME_0H03004g1_1 n=1 Tax=Lachancea meyersii CBS 8951 TaxID=1266667 RepID=A0A1G4KDJ3_9SACH|nr:LAME_0H03004g1_1 [Lachancea meyersii CBS 8951]